MKGRCDDLPHLMGSEARIAPGDTTKVINGMSTRQIDSTLMLLVGVVMLGASIGTAWMLSRFSRVGNGERGWFAITVMVSIGLFLGGIIVCYYGVRAFLGG